MTAFFYFKKVLNSKKGYKTEEDYIKQKIQS